MLTSGQGRYPLAAPALRGAVLGVEQGAGQGAGQEAEVAAAVPAAQSGREAFQVAGRGQRRQEEAEPQVQDPWPTGAGRPKRAGQPRTARAPAWAGAGGVAPSACPVFGWPTGAWR